MTYHVYDITVDDRIVYVGLSKNPVNRKSQIRMKFMLPIFRTKVRVVASYEDRAEGLRAEAERIKALRPPGNFVHNAEYDDVRERDSGCWAVVAEIEHAHWKPVIEAVEAELASQEN